MKSLLVSQEVDRILRYPRGRSLRLARAGQFPHVVLPDGEIRFDRAEIEKMLGEGFEEWIDSQRMTAGSGVYP